MKKKLIYIIGAVGSGKTTLAKEIEKASHYKHVELDYLIYKFDELKGTTRTRDIEEVLTLINSIISSNDKIVFEDVGNESFTFLYESIDLFVILNTGLVIRMYRIIKRFFKRLISIEKYGFDYHHSFKQKLVFTYDLLKLTKRFEKDYRSTTLDKITKTKTKIIYLNNRKDVEKFIKEFF